MSAKVDRLIEGFKALGKWGTRGLQSDVAKKASHSESYVSQIFAGKRTPSDSFLHLACLSFGINPKYVIDGEGSVLIDSPVEETVDTVVDDLGLTIYRTHGGVKADIWAIVEGLSQEGAIRLLQLIVSHGLDRET